MNNKITIGILMAFLFFVSCKSNSTDNTTINKTDDVALKKNILENKEKVDALDRLNSRFTRFGLRMSKDQLREIRELASSTDFEAETVYEEKIKFKDFMDDVIEKILTEEQKNKVNNKMRNRKK